MSTAIASVIPTYRPPEQILALIDVLRLHGPVIVSDDASPCTFDRLLLNIASRDGVTVFRHPRNLGIGRGLNDGLRSAHGIRASWLLTADQDSLVTTDYIDGLLHTARRFTESELPVGVIAAETILDHSGPIDYPSRKLGDFTITEEVIQSGSLWSVNAINSIFGFDERLGNDAVDAAACLALREQGFLVGLAPGISFQHRIGSASQHRLLGRKIVVTHHSAERQRAMLRNRLLLLPREIQQSPHHAFRSIRRVLVNLTMGRLHRT